MEKQLIELKRRLLPCPVCGNKKPYIEPFKWSAESPVLYGVKCPMWAYDAKYTLYYQDVEAAVREWNKRPRKGANND